MELSQIDSRDFAPIEGGMRRKGRYRQAATACGFTLHSAPMTAFFRLGTR